MTANNYNGALTLITPSHPRMLSVIRASLGELATQLGFDYEEVQDLKLAVDEACANVIKHAYHGDENGKIVVKFLPAEDRIEIRIRDYGKKVSADRFRSRDLDDLQPQGIGIYLMRTLTDEMHYNHSLPIGTELTLTKYLKQKKHGKVLEKELEAN